MISIKKLIKRVEGKWKGVDPRFIKEEDLSGMVIQLKSGKAFILKEIKNI